VSRIYRLLQQHTAKISPNGTGLIEQKLLEQKVRNLQHLLDAAAKTADASQTYWKAKVDELRQRIDELERGVREAVAVGITQDSVQEKIKALAVEGGRLEVLLRAFGPETMKGKLIELVREVMR
jgi:hypothetical protein